VKYLSFVKDYKKVLFIALFVFALISAVLIFSYSQNHNRDYSLSLMASQFIKGHLSFEYTKEMPLGDISKFNGKFYLFYAPFASIILTPFVLVFGKGFPQYFLGLSALIGSFLAVFSISKFFKFKKIDSLFIAMFFCFSTVLFAASLINISAYQVQALGVLLLVLALREYLVNKRMLAIGILIGLSFLTRPNLILALIFFLLEFWQKRITLKDLIKILIPVFISILIFAIYNFVRFHSFFDTGYEHSVSLAAFPLSHNLDFGYMSLSHIPANLYSMLFMAPQPVTHDQFGFVLKFPYLAASPWGMAIWFTSPLLLKLLFNFKKGIYTLSAFITVLALLIPVLVYYSIGFSQYGYRYVLDFLPFLLLILIPSLSPKLSKNDLIFIALGVIFNCIYITSLWKIYPLFNIF